MPNKMQIQLCSVLNEKVPDFGLVVAGNGSGSQRQEGKAPYDPKLVSNFRIE
jgi:hypothetical protein